MPSTQPSSECVDRMLSRNGTRMLNSSLVPSGVPSVKIENEASCPQTVLKVASAAAIFIGWVATITRLSWSPTIATRTNDTTVDHSPKRSVLRIISVLRPRAMCQAETATMTMAANIQPAKIVWGKAARATGLVSMARSRRARRGDRPPTSGTRPGSA